MINACARIRNYLLMPRYGKLQLLCEYFFNLYFFTSPLLVVVKRNKFY